LSGIVGRTGRAQGRPRMGKSSAEEHFTVFFVSSRGRSRSVSFGLRTLRFLTWALVACVGGAVALGFAFHMSRKELLDLRYARDMVEAQKQQIQSLEAQFSALNERLRQAESAEVQIRGFLQREGVVPQTYEPTADGRASQPRTGQSVSRGLSSSRILDAKDLSRRILVLTSEASGLSDRTTQVEGRMSDLREEAEDLVALLRATPCIWPTDGEISSGFGWRTNPFGEYESEYHSGVDIAAQWWDPIVATADGTVTFAGYKYGYGWTVVIDHGKGFETLYAHCCRLEVEYGQRVTRGEVIGYVGESGSATGPHLHYEVHVWGECVDPMQYLPQYASEVNRSVR